MTAKEQLLERIEAFSEHEAERTLRLLDDLDEPAGVLLDDAPADDEPTTPDEEAAVQEALDAAARGETLTLDELRAGLRRRRQAPHRPRLPRRLKRLPESFTG